MLFLRSIVIAWLCSSFLFSQVHATDTIKILALGDSLFAGRGLSPEFGITSQLEQNLQKRGYSVKITNSGVSGDTTFGGLSRIDWVLSDPHSGVILCLGYNDAFRGIPVADVRENLRKIIEKVQSQGVPILLAGVLAPRNLGADYYEEFDTIYPDLAEQYNLLLYPFILEGVATEPKLNQQDGIHPNEAGVAVIVNKMLPIVEQFIGQVIRNNAEKG